MMSINKILNRKVYAVFAAAFFALVLVLPSVTPSLNAQTAGSANHPLFATFCPRELVQHWDKIQFNVFEDRQGVRVLVAQDLDIKVIDDPAKAADLRAKVLKFLAGNPVVDPTGQVIIITPTTTIEIVDVEYAIICTR
jgi:hypothetical protein